MCACAEATHCTQLYPTVCTAQVGGYIVLGMLEEEHGVTEGTQWYGGSWICLHKIMSPVSNIQLNIHNPSDYPNQT